MFQKIGVKLIVAIALTALVIIGIFSYFQTRNQKEAMIEIVKHNGTQLSEIIKMSLHDDMLLNQREHIYKLINRIGNAGEGCIKKIRIFNKTGEVIYSSDSTDIGTKVDLKDENCYACHAANKPLEKVPVSDRTRIFKSESDLTRLLGIINPIYNEPSCYNSECHAHPKSKKVLGVLDVTFCLKLADRAIQKNQFTNLVLAVVSILAFSILIGLFVKKWIDNPVKELVKATNRVALGNLDQPIEYERKDELGILARSFNNMMKKLAEMRVQLFQSDKMASLGRLAAGVAHEINNPLTGVLTYSSFLLKRAKDPQLQKDLDVIVRETKRSRDIVKGLLDFARQSTPKQGKVDIKEVINNAITVISNQLKIHKIHLEKEIDEKLPEISGDANQIQQVILNLVVNAIDAMDDKGGTLTINCNKISLVPYGVKQIKHATCPKGHILMDEDHKIDGMPSIKLLAKSGSNEGFVHLDPIYGRHQHHYGIQFKENEIVRVFCPTCGISLVDEEDTGPICNAPVYKIIIPNQGTLVGCTKYSCNWQKWDYIDSKGKQDYIKIQISDTGSGIKEEDLNKIFEPFFTTKGQKGTGLGLSIVWGIIDNHNGKISVDSKIGKGTTFTIQLPVNEQT